jgi:hypothetical protein
VSDTGIGLDEDIKRKCFTSFENLISKNDVD